MKVGRVTKVDGIRVSATFYERLQPFLVKNGKPVVSPRINSFVKTGVGLDSVICQIVGEHEAEFDKTNTVAKADQAAPVGAFVVDLEVRGHIANGIFKGGLRCLPIVGASIETLGGDELAMLYSSHGAKPMRIGRSLFDETNSVYIDAGKLMASHIGVFGNTGSGKSNTLASIINKYTQLFAQGNPKARIIVFDLNNEYGGDAIVPYDQKVVYHLNTRVPAGTSDAGIPLDVDALSEDSWGTILRATQKTQMPIVRRAFYRWKNSTQNDFIAELRQSLVDKRNTLFFALRNYCESLVVGIEDFSYNSVTQSFYYAKTAGGHIAGRYINADSDIDTISIAPSVTHLEEFYLFLTIEVARAAESGINFEFVQPLLPRAKAVIRDLGKLFAHSAGIPLSAMFRNKNIAVIQLGDVNSSSREMLPSLLADLVMQDAAVAKGNGAPQQVTTLVIDEAHNLLGYDAGQSDLVHDSTLRIFERVIKEGRKFGVFLCLASQRPSDISPTITSQIHNYFIHKLVNPNDIERIRRTVSFMGEGSLAMLSALGQGECIVSGPSLYMPQFVYIEQLNKDNQPNSSDLDLFGEDGILSESSTTQEREF
ncbi:ATP-binding protein [Thermophilibacter immobilis]|uniref:ATP-binding protein n=1 Tax=Thermophilibacter immobilis TaxID=2779519 RepID=A0A7S7M8W2_9ACTN|nr:ATP-binding protein [Thermophilibacter immobilis]QOY60894.1 ATP-binding protein [Thermophilibacter immobilis]